MTFRALSGTGEKVIGLCLLIFLAVQVQEVLTVDFDCNFNQHLQTGQTYYIYVPRGFDGIYHGPRSCQWYASTAAGNRIRLSCGKVNLPSDSQCSGDRVTVNVGSRVRRHCGTDWFLDESDGNEILINLLAQPGSSGQLLCSLQVLTPADDKCQCGYKNPNKIVGGVNTGVNEFPMMVGLVDIPILNIFCGGTLITDKHVLTARHCLLAVPITDLGCIVGLHSSSLSNRTAATRGFRVSAIYTPTDSRETNNGFNGDIGIVVINGTVLFNAAVGPACLPFIHAADFFYSQRVVLLGWGTTEFGGPKADVLQKVDVNVVTLTRCQKDYRTVTTSQLCTFGDEKDACQMDSGGPVLWEDRDRRIYDVVGVIINGIGCATDAAGVNSRVGAYMGWIIDQTLDYKYCIRG